MADKARYRSGIRRERQIPMTTTLPIDIGDLVKLTSGIAEKADAESDNLAIAGVCIARKGARDSGEFCIVAEPIPGTEFEFELDTATTIVVGDQLQISTDNSDAQTLSKGTTDAIMIATRAGTTITSVYCEFKLPQTFQGDAS